MGVCLIRGERDYYHYNGNAYKSYNKKRIPPVINRMHYVFAARNRTSSTRRDDDNGALDNDFSQPHDDSDNCHGNNE